MHLIEFESPPSLHLSKENGHPRVGHPPSTIHRLLYLKNHANHSAYACSGAAAIGVSSSAEEEGFEPIGLCRNETGTPARVPIPNHS